MMLLLGLVVLEPYFDNHRRIKTLNPLEFNNPPINQSIIHCIFIVCNKLLSTLWFNWISNPSRAFQLKNSMMFEWGKTMGLDSTIEAWPLLQSSFINSCQHPLHPTYLMTLTLSIIGTKDGNCVHFMHEYRMQRSSPFWQRGWESPLSLGDLSKKVKSTFWLFWGWREVISGPANAEICF